MTCIKIVGPPTGINSLLDDFMRISSIEILENSSGLGCQLLILFLKLVKILVVFGSLTIDVIGFLDQSSFFDGLYPVHLACARSLGLLVLLFLALFFDISSLLYSFKPIDLFTSLNGRVFLLAELNWFLGDFESISGWHAPLISIKKSGCVSFSEPSLVFSLLNICLSISEKSLCHWSFGYLVIGVQSNVVIYLIVVLHSWTINVWGNVHLWAVRRIPFFIQFFSLTSRT